MNIPEKDTHVVLGPYKCFLSSGEGIIQVNQVNP